MSAPSNRTAVVTGTTGGIGAEVAKLLAADGWNLVLVNRSANKPQPLVERIERSFSNRRVEVLEADLSHHSAIAEVTQRISQSHPSIEALFNVAGFLSKDLKRSPQGHDLHLEVNTLAPLSLLHGLRSSLAAGAAEVGRAVVVNVTSNAIGMSGPLDVERLPDNPKQGIFGAYGQTKLALTAATFALAPIYARHGIHLYVVDPGGNRTSMTKSDAAPFFIRWMSALLPGPEKGARKLLEPLDDRWAKEAGALVVGGKTKNIPRQAGGMRPIAELLDRLNEWSGHDLARAS